MEEKQANGILPPAQLDPISPFSQPPAPPPQQPLPEKPDVARFNLPSPMSQTSLKRTDTERPRSGLSSPTRVESGQIMSLVEALKFKERELDSKVDYIKSLEVDLAREKQRREAAERKLSGDHPTQSSQESNGAVEKDAFEPPLDEVEMMSHGLPNGHTEGDGAGSLSRSSSVSTMKNVGDSIHQDEDVSSLASRLQAQLDLRNREMNDMKILMESYRQKADDAEEGRRSLAEMVECIRAGRDPKSAQPPTSDDDLTLVGDSQLNGRSGSSNGMKSQNPNSSALLQQQQYRQPNGSAAMGNIHREIEKTVSNVLQQQQREWSGPGEHGRMVHRAPYVSMVGVVLIGVGIMTWLNGWQPGGDK